jgi:hypothetical protein
MVFLKWTLMSIAIATVAAGVEVALALLGRGAATGVLLPIRDLRVHSATFYAWLTLQILVTAKYLHQMWFRLCDKDVDGESPGTRWR